MFEISKREKAFLAGIGCLLMGISFFLGGMLVLFLPLLF